MLICFLFFGCFNSFFSIPLMLSIFYSYLTNSFYFPFYTKFLDFIWIWIWKILFILNDVQFNIIFFLLLACIYIKHIWNLNKMLLLSVFFFFLKPEVTSVFSFLERYWIYNVTLTNGLAVIHPILVYLVYIFIIKMVIKNNKYNFYFLKKDLNICLSLCLSALFLGSWWAEQELNWGGWWNWDFVELILFIFLIKLIVITHMNKNKFFFQNKVQLSSVVFYFVVFFVFVRWDIINSVHSFNTLNFLEKYSHYIVVFLFLLIVVQILNFYWKYINSNYNFEHNNMLAWYNILLNSITLLITGYFFINVYFTIYFELDFVEITKSLKSIIIYITIFIFFFMQKKKINIVIYIYTLIIIHSGHYELLLMYISLCFLNVFKKHKLIIYLHFIVIIFVTIILLFINISSLYYLSTYSNKSLNFYLNINNTLITKNLNGSLNFLKIKENITIYLNNNYIVNSCRIYNVIGYFNIYSNYLTNINIVAFLNATILIYKLNNYILILYVYIFLILKSKIYKHTIKHKYNY